MMLVGTDQEKLETGDSEPTSVSSSPPLPPPYTNNMNSHMMDNNGFPLGYFMIRSVATGCVLDVASDRTKDGAEVILWHAKESSLVEGLRKAEAENQVFFIDTTGALCSRHSGHAIDVEDGRIVLRHRRPIMYPFPNAFSHPLPQFRFDRASGQISVEFQCDPSFTDKQGGSSRKTVSLLASMPKRKPKSVLEEASTVINNVLASPLTFFGIPSPGAPPKATAEDVAESNIDLREDELLEGDWGESEEMDDSPDWHRNVRVIRIDEQTIANENAGSDTGLSLAAGERRRWEILSLRTSKASNASRS